MFMVFLLLSEKSLYANMFNDKAQGKTCEETLIYSLGVSDYYAVKARSQVWLPPHP